MALSKSLAHVLREVFGYKDGGAVFSISTQPKSTLIVYGSNEWKAAVELVRHGLVVITQPTKLGNNTRFCYFVQPATMAVPADHTVYTGEEKVDFTHD